MVINKKLVGAVLAVAAVYAAGICPSMARPITESGLGSIDGGGVTSGVDPEIIIPFQSLTGDLTGFVDLHPTFNSIADPNVYTATGGTITEISTGPAPSGVFPLIPPVPSGLSPSGAFIYDDLVDLNPGDPVVTSPGLLFQGPGLEINLFSTSPTTYTYYLQNGFNEPIIFGPAVVIPVPLPASAGVGFGMLAGFGALFAARKRLSRRPRIA